MADQKKLQQYVQLNTQIKELKVFMDALGKEIMSDFSGKETIGEYVLAKREKFTYSLKPDIDVKELSALFPTAIVIKVDAKEVYRISDEPDQFVDKKLTEYLDLRKGKDKLDEIDF